MDADKVVAEAAKGIENVSHSLNAKMRQGGAAEDGPLKESREEMAKLKEEITKAEKSIGELKKKFADGKKAFEVKLKAERNAHIEARNAKEAAPFLEGPTAKMEALEADAKAAEEAGAPMAKL